MKRSKYWVKLETNSSIISQKDQPENGCFKKTKQVKFSEKGTFFTYVCVSGSKKCSFFGKFCVHCFLETPVLRFALLAYYRRFLTFRVLSYEISFFKKYFSTPISNQIELIVERIIFVIETWCCLSMIWIFKFCKICWMVVFDTEKPYFLVADAFRAFPKRQKYKNQ